MDQDNVPPLLGMDGDNMATATGSSARRPSLRMRTAGPNMMHSGVQRARSRQFSQSSMDSFLPPRIPEPSHQEPKEPSPFRFGLLLLVALPILAGTIFENGSSVMVDLLLVIIGCLILYWSIEYPWEWYDSARVIASMENTSDIVEGSAVSEESTDGEKGEEITKPSKAESKSSTPPLKQFDPTKRDDAVRSLNAHELLALSACFVSPPLAAYILHRIRQYLDRPSGTPVESAPLTLFVLGAEILPIRRVAEMTLARTLHLQKIVLSYDSLEDAKRRERREVLNNRLQGMAQRIEALESHAVTSSSTPADTKQPISIASEQLRLSHQNQLDALNRAVRRYEKRALTQSIMVEARLKDLEAKINDALTLSAAASRRSERTTVISVVLDTTASLVMLPLVVVRSLFSWPVEMCSDIYRFLFGPRRRKKKPRGGLGSRTKPEGS